MTVGETNRSDNRDMIWVSPEGSDAGEGTRQSPFRTVTAAAARGGPGVNVVLMAGEYSADTTIQVSGTIDRPLKITAEKPGAVTIAGGGWYLYDTSDVIVSGIHFHRCERNAITVLGQCRRSSFEHLRFTDCATAKEGGCALYLGGSGGHSVVVEDCTFEMTDPSYSVTPLTIALMVAEGNDESSGEPNRDYVLRRNRFVGYGSAILTGSRGVGGCAYGHVIEANEVIDCCGDGVRTRCGDTIVRGNRLVRCAGTGVAVVSGDESVVEGNRIESCGCGVSASGMGHSVVDNCIVTCGTAIRIPPVSGQTPAGINIVVEHNTCVESGITDGAIVVADDAICVVRRNRVIGAVPLRSIAVEGIKPRSLVTDNVVCDAAVSPGFVSDQDGFADRSVGNFSVTNGAGACGWAATGGPIPGATDDYQPVAGVSIDDPAAFTRLVEGGGDIMSQAMATSLELDEEESADAQDDAECED